MADRLEQHWNCITAAASTLVAFCTHYMNLIMASLTKSKERTHWTEGEVDALVTEKSKHSEFHLFFHSDLTEFHSNIY